MQRKSLNTVTSNTSKWLFDLFSWRGLGPRFFQVRAGVTSLKAASLLLFIGCVAALFTACSSSAPIMQCNYQSSPVTVDGKAKEWSIPLQYYDDKTKLNFTITNDDTCLYYCFRITDDKEEMRVLRAGMQIWIDTTGKNQKQVGIEFPFQELKEGADNGGKKGNSRPDTIGHQKRLTFATPQKQIRVTGFKYPIAGIVQLPNPYGIKASIARDSAGITIYEASIPFRTFYKKALTASDNTRTFGISIILNPMGGSGSEGGHKGGHGGDAGGMGGGGNMGGNMGMHAAGLGGVGAPGGMGGGGGHRGGGRDYGSDDPDDNTNVVMTCKLRVHFTVQ